MCRLHLQITIYLIFFSSVFRSSTEEEDNGSVCSCDDERPGNAFPKAFDSDLIVKKSNHLLVSLSYIVSHWPRLFTSKAG